LRANMPISNRSSLLLVRVLAKPIPSHIGWPI
jgi:hypothetical protein